MLSNSLTYKGFSGEFEGMGKTANASRYLLVLVVLFC